MTPKAEYRFEIRSCLSRWRLDNSNSYIFCWFFECNLKRKIQQKERYTHRTQAQRLQHIAWLQFLYNSIFCLCLNVSENCAVKIHVYIFVHAHIHNYIYIYVFLMRIIQINTHARTDIYSMPYAYIYKTYMYTYMYEIHKGAFTVQHLKRQRALGCQENFIALWSFRRPRGMRNCRKRSAKRFRSRPLP